MFSTIVLIIDSKHRDHSITQIFDKYVVVLLSLGN